MHVSSHRGEASAPDFSVLVTCHFEEKSIDEFHARLTSAMQGLGRPYEIIMVNDGSTDRTWERVKALYEKDPNIRVIMDFFANAGQQSAITAALNEARGKAIVLIDSDLQLAPEEFPLLVAEFDKGYDLVSGYRKNRKDSLFRIIPSKLANAIMRRASHSTLRDFGCTFKIYNGDLLRAFEFGPRHIFSNVTVIAKINRYHEVPVTHCPRKYGKSGWTFRKLWQYNMDNVVNLSQRPFQILAGICMIASVVFFLRILGGFFIPGQIMSEVTNGLILNALAFSLLLTLGVLSMVGEFAIRCFTGLQKTPAYIVREKHIRPDAPPVS